MRLEPDEFLELKAISKRMCRKPSEIVRYLIKKCIEERGLSVDER
ncbi:MAG: hypothetical protein QXN34_06965 [Archaeoglobaceae archaeon]